MSYDTFEEKITFYNFYQTVNHPKDLPEHLGQVCYLKRVNI